MDEARWNQIISAMGRGPPSMEREDDRPVVFFRTPWERLDDGWSIAARAYARVMEMGGLNVCLSSWSPYQGAVDETVLADVGHMAKTPTVWDAHVFSCTLGPGAAMAPIMKNMRDNQGPQAYHCVFERQYIEPELVDALNLLDGVWAQCSANRDVLVNHGVKNVTLIHHPWFDDDPHLNLEPPRQCKRFYWIGRSEPRKAPDRLVRAFVRAFKPGEAELTLKLSMYLHPGAYPPVQQALAAELPINGWTRENWQQHIHIIHDRLSRDGMVRLHADHDVYVSASRGEGLDLPAFAAKLAGRQLVLTDSGGPRDFVNDGDVLVPACGLVPASPEYPWGDGATYFDHRLEDLVAALQSVRGKRPVGSRVPEKLNARNVSREMSRWIESLRCGE